MGTIVLVIIIGFIIYFLVNQNSTGLSKQKVHSRSSEQRNKSDTITQKELKELDPFYKLNQTVYDKNPDQPNIPNIVRICRIENKGRNLQKLHDEYFSILPSLMENKPDDIKEFFEKIDKSLLLLEPLIIYEKKQWRLFDIKSLPAIENGLLYSSILGNCEKANDISNMIKFFPELGFYKQDANDSIRFCALLPELIDFITRNGGVKVIDLKDYFDKDYDLVKNRIYYLAKLGVLKTTKVGKSNFYQVN